MHMEIHDTDLDDPRGTLCADIGNIDYGYQAEQWVIDTHKDHPGAVLWLLFLGDKPENRVGRDKDFRFLTQVWERPPGSEEMPTRLAEIENWQDRVKYPLEEPKPR